MSATTITRTLKVKNNKPIGLGLPFSYEVVKAHSGKLSVRTPLEKVETLLAGEEEKEGEGVEFIIILPVN